MFCVIQERSELIGDTKYAEYSSMRKFDEGSFGDLFTVYKKKSCEIFALKQLLFRGSVHDDPYILKELWCLSRLKHINIVKLTEVIFLPGEVDIIMEYAEKGNLESYITENWPLQDRDIFDIFRQCLSAISFCHSRFVAHRDINPSNILLTKDHVIKLVDFGLATRCFDDQGNYLMCSDYLGRCHYLAPEVFAKRPYDPLAADVWALGILLYFIIAASVPGRESDMETKKQLENGVQLPKWIKENWTNTSASLAMFLNYILNPVAVSRPTVEDIRRLWCGIGKHFLVISNIPCCLPECKSIKRKSLNCV